jgi:hypothetical protein
MAALGALLGVLTAWGAVFIFRTSFVLDGRRVFCLFDDAMISMTYARNLVEGFGLNWARRGAPVEGFTHPLWTALMVPVNALPLSLDRRSLLMQAASLVLLLANVVLVRRLMLRHFSRPGARHWLPACVLTAFYYPLDFWALIGMETGLQALLTTAMALFALDIVHGRRDRHLALLLVSAAAALLRLDMLLPVAAVQLWVWAWGGLQVGRQPAPPGGRPETAGGRSKPRNPGWRLGALLLALALAGYGAFRWVYFHDLLPNTYYLKMTGIPLAVRLLRGGSVLLDSLRAHGPLLLAVAIGVQPQLFTASRRRRRMARRDAGEPPAAAAAGWPARLALPAALFALCCAYSVYVGGDAWEDEVRANRFVAFAMPMIFVLWNALCNQALSALAAWRRLRRRRLARRDGVPQRARRRDPLLTRLALTAATVGALLLANGLWLQDSADDNWQALLLLSRPLHTDKYAEILGQVRKLEAIADPDAAVAVTWAGITAYFSDFKMVDELGYNDRHIAHGAPALEVNEDTYSSFVPGHAKWDLTYVVEEQRPDALLQIWGGREAVIVLRRHGYRRVGDLWVDPRSPRIHLERLPADGAGGEAGAAGAAGPGGQGGQGGLRMQPAAAEPASKPAGKAGGGKHAGGDASSEGGDGGDGDGADSGGAADAGSGADPDSP